MREIKFRAWNKTNNKMIDNNNLLKICFVRTDHTPNLIVYTDKVINCYIELKESDKRYNNEFELMQYTGLKDRNGKEIYEGDILNTLNSKRIVVFNEDTCSFMLKDIKLRNELFSLNKEKCTDLEIIGNIYENPELLKENR